MAPKGKGNSYPTPQSVQNMFQGYNNGSMPGMMPQQQWVGQGGGFPQQWGSQMNSMGSMGAPPQWAMGGGHPQWNNQGGGFQQQQWGGQPGAFPPQWGGQMHSGMGPMGPMGSPHQWGGQGGYPQQQMPMQGMMQPSQQQQPGMYPRVKKSNTNVFGK